MVYDILERKSAFLDYKNNKLKCPKIGICPKRLVHGFGVKLSLFLCYYFREIKGGQRNVLRYSGDKKNAFLDYKNNKFNKG